MRKVIENHLQIQKIKKAILTTLIMGLFFLLGGQAFANNILLAGDLYWFL